MAEGRMKTCGGQDEKLNVIYADIDWVVKVVLFMDGKAGM